MKKMLFFIVCSVAALSVQAQGVAVCNHWKNDIKVGLTQDPEKLVTIEGSACKVDLRQQKGKFTYLVIDGTLHTLRRSFPEKRIEKVNADKATRGYSKRLVVSYDGGEYDVYVWDSARKMFILKLLQK